ncbi:MAG: SAM-dependent chlorinase/fluorinase [Candidatus Eisenbacteria bacterium]
MRLMCAGLVAVFALSNDSLAAETVALLSDYGPGSTTPALCHGALAAGLTDVRVLDLSHGVPVGDTETGAVMLRRIAALPVHTVVIGLVGDGAVPPPQLVAFQTSRGFYCIGPNDGLFGWVVKQQGVFRVVEIDPAMVMPGFQGDGTDTWKLLTAAAVRFCNNGRDLLTLGPGIADSDLITGDVSECSASRGTGDVKGVVLRDLADGRSDRDGGDGVASPNHRGAPYLSSGVLTNVSTGAVRLAGLRLDEDLELELGQGDHARTIELDHVARGADPRSTRDSSGAKGDRLAFAVFEDLVVFYPEPGSDLDDRLMAGETILVRRVRRSGP